MRSVTHFFNDKPERVYLPGTNRRAGRWMCVTMEGNPDSGPYSSASTPTLARRTLPARSFHVVRGCVTGHGQSLQDCCTRVQLPTPPLVGRSTSVTGDRLRPVNPPERVYARAAACPLTCHFLSGEESRLVCAIGGVSTRRWLHVVITHPCRVWV